jgi:hypothetical protein
MVIEPAEEPVATTTTVTTTVPSTTTATTAPEPATTAVLPVAPPAPPSTAQAADTIPPFLTITSPEEGAQLEEKVVTFRGLTEPGAQVFAGRYEAEVDPEGNWQLVLVLAEGPNTARFTARDAAGNEARAAVSLSYLPPTTTTESTTTTEPEKELAAFEAYATFGVCTETPPYDIYYGSGEPGSKIYVESDFGSGVTEVNGEGAWEIKVDFPEAEPGATFLVKVSDQYGRQKSFEFRYEA